MILHLQPYSGAVSNRYFKGSYGLLMVTRFNNFNHGETNGSCSVVHERIYEHNGWWGKFQSAFLRKLHPGRQHELSGWTHTSISPAYFPAATEPTAATVLKIEDGQTIERM